MSSNNEIEEAYAFQLDAKKDEHFYYRTVSLWCGHASHGRDKRFPLPVIVDSFHHIMKLLGESYIWVRESADVQRWCRGYGWMLTPAVFAKAHLGPLLEPRTCVKSPLGLFWDVEIPRRCAERRQPPRDVRNIVFKRDGHRCVECGESEADGVKLTLDHVIPFTRGGETTEWNLVTMCKSCNQKHGNDYHPHVFALAGLHHGWDPSLINATPTNESMHHAMMLSQNIMVSRCKVCDINTAGTIMDEGG